VDSHSFNLTETLGSSLIGGDSGLAGGNALPASYYLMLSDLSTELEGVDRIGEMAERLNRLPFADRQVVREIFKRLAREMITLDATDIDVGGPACLEQVWYRVDGYKKPYENMGRFTQSETDAILLTLLSPIQQQHLLSNLAFDMGYQVDMPDNQPPRRYRATVYFDNQFLALGMRMLARKPYALRSLGFHPFIERGLMFRHVRDGLTLITGVTGSGKSTTLDAIVDANNDDIEAHILIVAQPLEYIHTSRKCVIRHREVGKDVPTFVQGLVQGLRQDPDIVVVGEMRDKDTISTAMETSDTGHKVFSTLHTGSAIESIDRIVAEYPPTEQERIRHRLAEVLRCIISQKLLPGIGGGRVLAKEVMWMTSSEKAAIKNGNTAEVYQMMWEGAKYGKNTLEQDLFKLIRQGEITPEIAQNYANNKRRLMSLFD